jgi:hypothetical protein
MFLRKRLAESRDHKRAETKIQTEEVISIADDINMEFATLVNMHESMVSMDFNDDAKYKELTSEAIDQKNFAIEKMKTFLAYKRATSDVLTYIFNCSLNRFKTPHVVLKALDTRIFDFPWENIYDHTITLDSWHPDAMQIDKISEEMKGNHVLQKVIVNGVEFALNSGWKTEKVEWNFNSGASTIHSETFALVSRLLLSNCFCLKMFKLNFG